MIRVKAKKASSFFLLWITVHDSLQTFNERQTGYANSWPLDGNMFIFAINCSVNRLYSDKFYIN